MPEIAKVIISQFKNVYPNVKKLEKVILEEITKEEKQFGETLEKGLKEFEKLVAGFEIAFAKTGKKIDIIA